MTWQEKVEEFLLGGPEAVKSKRAAEKEAWNKFVHEGTSGAVIGTVKSSFDIIVWIKENWQLAIIGFIALLVLLRD